MNPKDLLSQLTRLEHTLNDFSFEELTAAEAAHLKKSFQTFRVSLENKIFTPSNYIVEPAEIDIQEDSRSKNLKKNNIQSPNADMLVAKVSHEIRTPLNGIIGFADLLKEDKLTKTQLERVNAIQTASYGLMEIINELLEYSKLSAGLEQFESVDFNLNSVVDNVVYLCDTLITDKNVELLTTIDNEVPEGLIGDPSKLSQILLNLLGNAVKFVEEGSIHLTIELRKQRGNQLFLAFSIADTGIGISKNSLDHIFDSYKQAEYDTKAKYGGSGLGLSIVKQIIDNLGGDISVDSKLGEGTIFRFMLPYKKGSIENIVKRDSTISINSDELLAVKGLRILVFEDNVINQKLIAQRLKSWQCKTYVTDNALYGLNLLETNQIDMVLMDLKMPEMSGFEVTRLIRKSEIESVKQMPVIAVSADFTAQDREKCLQHKINDFILKPYSPDELLTKLVKHKNRMKTTLTLESQTINPEIEVYSDATKINLSIILEDCLGQMDLLEELVMLYKQNALEFIGIVKLNLDNENLEEVAFAAHKIKSGLAMMQSKSLYTLVEQIQKICKTNGDRKHLNFLHNCFVEEYPLVENAIDEQIKALKNN
ncbi:response regulator [Maribacter algarum]|uniref:histidine kinase n=1 Tax=Maribacter algarum (ex Zhang et al. 2020) TaxID=2578118 RepID=A0A5S3PRM9_9FLAO|nr:ATP-binding protein [Maribacter algarum]TMM57372.1 response regulator [Maribacter algarum]